MGLNFCGRSKIHGNDQLQNEFVKFHTKQYPYDKVVKDDCDPILYWKSMACFEETHALAKVALKLIAFPQSSANVERTFSSLRRIHTWQRSSIGREKLAKLVYIYINRHALHNENMLRS